MIVNMTVNDSIKEARIEKSGFFYTSEKINYFRELDV